MARLRSPNYPAISLSEAVQRVERLIRTHGEGPYSRDQTITGLGYGGENGASLGALSASRKYRLVAKAGDTFRLTGIGTKVMAKNAPEVREKALREAAHAPTLFAELFGAQRVKSHSDEELANILQDDGFSVRAAKAAIATFRATEAFIGGAAEIGRDAAAAAGNADGRVDELIPPFTLSIVPNRLQVNASLGRRSDVDALIKALEAAAALLPQ